MKNLLFVIILIPGFLLSLHSQQVPNGSFESWTGNTPNFWDTSNENIIGTQYTTVSKVTTNVQHGTAAVKVTTERRYVFLVGYITLPGILTLGDFVMDYIAQTGVINGGEPFAYRPTSLKGYYKRTQVTGDSALVGLGFSKWNPVTNKRDTVGLGVGYFNQTVSTWTQFDIPIDWTSPEFPDTFNIIIASSDVVYGSTFVEGSTIWIDNLYFEYLVTVGGDVTGITSNICEGDNTGTLTLSGQTGTVLKWEKRLNGGNWTDISNTLTTYSEIPASSGNWEYRALVKNGNAPEAYSSTFSVAVHPHYVFNESDTIVSGASYTWHGNVYTTEGTYYDSLQTVYGCDSIFILNLTVLVSTTKTLTVNVLLESLYNESVPGTMNMAMNETGPEFTGDIADEITIELHNASDYSFIEFSESTFLSIFGEAVIQIPSSLNSSYYITVKHRNSIETPSASTFSLNGAGPFIYDYTLSQSQAYENNLVLKVGGYYAVFGGDVNTDGIIDGSDTALIDNGLTLLLTGYIPQDANGDGIVDASDMALIDNNVTKIVKKKIP